MLSATLLFLAQAAELPRSDPPEAQAYTGCIKAQATQLEPSGEPAETVADAVLFACGPLSDPAAQAIWKRDAAELKSRGVPPGNPEDFKKTLERAMRKAALWAVVNIRANRARDK